MFVVLFIGCAECSGGAALVDDLEFFDTIDEAKATFGSTSYGSFWKTHPLGGEYQSFSSGEYWVVPSSLFVKEK